MQRFRFKIFTQYLWLALFVIVLRVVFRLVFDEFEIDTALSAAMDGLQLAAWVLAFGLLNAILDFRKLLPRSPKHLKNFTTALNIALTLAPELARAVTRLKDAGRLRAKRRGFRLLQSLVIPVLSNAIDQAVDLGDSMEGRGFGRSVKASNVSGDVYLKNVSFGYRSELPIFKDLTVHIKPGQLVTVAGNTGSGKSTLLRVIQAKVPGSLYVHQFPRRGFVADTVFDELAFALRQSEKSSTEVKKLVAETAVEFGLRPFLSEDLRLLSAGWQQRVAIAAGVLSGARVLLLDEPLSALDREATEMLLESLGKLKQQGVTVVIAEHRIDELREKSDRLFTLEDGRLIEGVKELTQLITRVPSSGNVTVLLGANGSGKTTRLRKLAELGAVLVPQPASDLLYLNTVGEELRQADRDANGEPGKAAKVFANFGFQIDLDANPRDLSEGQKLALAISIQLVKPTGQLLLDEPTLGFDTKSRQHLADTICEIAQSGHEVIVATHDLEFANAIANQTESLERPVNSDVQ